MGGVPAKSFALVMLAVVLAACENPYIQQFRQEFGWTHERMLADGWLKAPPSPAQKVWCYETLADADCFAHPRRDHADRPATGRSAPPAF